MLVRLDPSSTNAEWHTLVQTTEAIWNDPEYELADEVAFLDLSQSFSDLTGKPTPRQIMDKAVAEIGEENIAVLFVATQRTFEPLRRPETAKLCTEEGALLPEEVAKMIKVLAIDRYALEELGSDDEDEGDEDGEPRGPGKELNPEHGYALLWGLGKMKGRRRRCSASSTSAT